MKNDYKDYHYWGKACLPLPKSLEKKFNYAIWCLVEKSIQAFKEFVKNPTTPL